MKTFYRSALLALLVAPLAFATNVSAKMYNVTVPSGKLSRIHNFYVYQTRTCYSAPFAKYSISQPKNGTISIKKVRAVVPKSAGKCAGKRLNMLAVFYKSKNGFRGKDAARIYFTHPSE